MAWFDPKVISCNGVDSVQCPFCDEIAPCGHLVGQGEHMDMAWEGGLEGVSELFDLLDEAQANQFVPAEAFESVPPWNKITDDQNPVDFFADRHDDIVRCCNFAHRFGSKHSFNNLLYFLLRFLDRLAGRKQNTHLAIAGLVVSAGQHQVTHAGKAHKRIVPRSECNAEAGHFDQPTIDQRDAGICAEAETIRNPGANGQYVLYSATDLYASHVVRSVRAEIVA